jgi:hypothetical protein
VGGVFYSGIGSRQTPPEILERMRDVARLLAEKGLVLRSGGADGADTAFEVGCDLARGRKEIYLPWRGFNGSPSDLHDPSPEAFEVSSRHHPRWRFLKHSHKKLHARNAHIVLGGDCLHPSAFVVCWTKASGGTTQGLRIAEAHGIPTFNLIREDDRARFSELIGSL